MLRVIASGFQSPDFTHETFDRPYGGPCRSGLLWIARINPNRIVTHTSSTGTVQSVRLAAKDSIRLPPAPHDGAPSPGCRTPPSRTSAGGRGGSGRASRSRARDSGRRC